MRKERGHEVWGPPRDPPASADVGALLKRTVRVSFFFGVAAVAVYFQPQNLQ